MKILGVVLFGDAFSSQDYMGSNDRITVDIKMKQVCEQKLYHLSGGTKRKHEKLDDNRSRANILVRNLPLKRQ
jgi:hypothetical protein